MKICKLAVLCLIVIHLAFTYVFKMVVKGNVLYSFAPNYEPTFFSIIGDVSFLGVVVVNSTGKGI